MKVVEKKSKGTSFYQKLAEESLYPMLKEMGNTQKAINSFQKKRIHQSLVTFLGMLLLGLFISRWFYLLSLVFSFLVYKMKYKNIQSKYATWKFQRHLQFSKFTRLLIPYLKKSKGQDSLYAIFNKILQRTDDEHDRNSLYRLMSEMSSTPNDIQPFTDFANRSSGTDMSVLFMNTIFDFQQSTFDTSVIDELGKIASDELLNGIDEIINFKLRRFIFFPTKIVMSMFIILLGFGVAVLVENITSMQFF